MSPCNFLLWQSFKSWIKRWNNQCRTHLDFTKATRICKEFPLMSWGYRAWIIPLHETYSKGIKSALGRTWDNIYQRPQTFLLDILIFSEGPEMKEIRQFPQICKDTMLGNEAGEWGGGNTTWKFLVKQEQNPMWPWPIRKMVCQREADIWRLTGTVLGNPYAPQIQNTWIPAEAWLEKPSLWITYWINGN